MQSTEFRGKLGKCNREGFKNAYICMGAQKPLENAVGKAENKWIKRKFPFSDLHLIEGSLKCA